LNQSDSDGPDQCGSGGLIDWTAGLHGIIFHPLNGLLIIERFEVDDPASFSEHGRDVAPVVHSVRDEDDDRGLDWLTQVVF